MSDKMDVKELVNELNGVNLRIEVLLQLLPMDDHRKISELYRLISKQGELMAVETTKESGTMFLDRAKRVAHFLKREYLNAMYDGRLRKERDDV